MTSLSDNMRFALAMFRDRPDSLTWHDDAPFCTCLFGLIPALRVPRSTVRALASRGLIEEKGRYRWMLSVAGQRAVAGHPRVYSHTEALIALRARQDVSAALKRALVGTRRKAA